MMSWKSSGAGRSNNFDFLRFALATLVIYSHSFDLTQHGNREPLRQLSHGQLTFGELAVDMFFVMSGFLITYSWTRSKHLFDFLQKRVLRIYPAFIVAVALGVFVLGPIGVPGKFQVNVSQWLLGTVNLRGYSPPNIFAHNPAPGVLNGSLWSIPYEFWCYIGVAILGMCALLKFPKLVLGIFLFSIVVSVGFASHPQFRPGGGRVFAVLFGNPPFWARLLPYYLAGVVFFLWRDRIPVSFWLAALSAALIAFSFYVPNPLGLRLPGIGVSMLFPIAATYLIFYLAYLPIPGLSHWARFGDFSYGMYLYAFPIQQWILMSHPMLAPERVFLLAAPATLVAAVASWHLVERPFLSMKRRPARQLPDARVHGHAKIAQAA